MQCIHIIIYLIIFLYFFIIYKFYEIFFDMQSAHIIICFITLL
jgi:hypothetical protein